MLSKHRSKKQSETGDWTEDADRNSCELCDCKFSITKRRHHCRKCGKLTCGSCSAHKMYLDISRSGKAKRVCNTCYEEMMGTGGDGKVDEAADELAAATISEGKEGEEGGAAGDASAGAGPAASAATASKPYSVMELPEVSTEEAVAALATTDFSGEWAGVMQFTTVDVGSQRKDAVVSGLSVASFAPRGPVVPGGRGRGATARRRRSSTNAQHVREGSRLRITMQLSSKSGGYINGVVESLGQFGKEGRLTGSLQKATGKVSMQVQIKNFGTTTSFNFIGHMSSGGELVGTFSGCEISKSAGSVSGIFKAAPLGADSDSG